MRAGTGRVGSVFEKRSRKSVEKLRKVKLADAVTSRQPVPLSYGQNVNTSEIFLFILSMFIVLSRTANLMVMKKKINKIYSRKFLNSKLNIFTFLY